MSLVILSELINVLLPLSFFFFSLYTISLQIIGIILVGYAVSISIATIGKILININAQETLFSFRIKIWNHILRLPTKFFDSIKSGELVSHFLADSQMINEFYFIDIPNFIPAFLTFIISLFFLILIDWKISLILVFALIITIILLLPIGIYNYFYSIKRQKIIAEISNNFINTINFIKSIKTNSGENKELNIAKNKLYEFKKINNKNVYITSLMEPLSIIIILAVIFGVGLYGSKLLNQDNITLNEILAILLYLVQVFMSGISVFSFFINYNSIKGISHKIKEIMNIKQEQNKNKINNITDIKTISFDQVSFSYNQTKDILNNIIFNVTKGDIVIIVGSIGSGKTTIFYLLAQLYKEYQGNIYINQTPANNISVYKLRALIGYVPQSSQIFDDTIENNIIYNYPDTVNKENIKKNINKLEMYNFIKQTPAGFQTKLGEGNFQISGGQKQLINIGRVIFNPMKKVILLDEISSNLDSSKEKQVNELIKKHSQNRITFYITHRVHNVHMGTKVMFIENGKIKGFNSHENLYNTSKKYKNYYDSYGKN